MPGQENVPLRHPSLACLRSLAGALALASLAACAPAAHPRLAPSVTPNQIVVHNYSWDRLTVYLTRQGTNWRLGTIEGLSQSTFSVPRAATATVDQLYLVARPIAGTAFRSEAFVLTDGTTAVWTVQNQPSTSYVMLR